MADFMTKNPEKWAEASERLSSHVAISYTLFWHSNGHGVFRDVITDAYPGYAVGYYSML